MIVEELYKEECGKLFHKVLDMLIGIGAMCSVELGDAQWVGDENVKWSMDVRVVKLGRYPRQTVNLTKWE